VSFLSLPIVPGSPRTIPALFFFFAGSHYPGSDAFFCAFESISDTRHGNHHHANTFFLSPAPFLAGPGCHCFWPCFFLFLKGLMVNPEHLNLSCSSLFTGLSSGMDVCGVRYYLFLSFSLSSLIRPTFFFGVPSFPSACCLELPFLLGSFDPALSCPGMYYRPVFVQG